MRQALRLVIAAAACALLAPAALAQQPANAEAVRALATYQGADREARLLDAARKEGEVTVYHAYPSLKTVLDAFSRKYGIKVKAWRSGSEAILQRMVSEGRAGRSEVDLVQNNAPEMEAAHREKLLQEVRSPYIADLIPQAAPAHREWVGITLDVWTAAYNTQKVTKAELPQSYQDLLDPKWKGRLAIEAEDQGWFGALVGELGEERGLALFRNIVATNGMSTRKGHSLLANLVASGEVPLALSVYSWGPPQLKAKGSPIESHVIQPVIAQPSSIALMKHAPHPAAALLLHDFLLTEGQKMLYDSSYVVTSRKFPSPVDGVQVKYIDPAVALDLQDKWLKNFQQIILRTGR